MPATNNAAVVELCYASFGRALHRPALPRDDHVVRACRLIISAVVIAPIIFGLTILLPLLYGASPSFFSRCLTWLG